MKISETLQKSSPLIPKREMSKSEYKKLVDTNTKLIDKMKDQEEEIERLNNIIKRLEEFIEKEIELYTVELTEENKNKLSIVAPIKGVYKEIYNVLQELKGDGSNEKTTDNDI